MSVDERSGASPMRPARTVGGVVDCLLRRPSDGSVAGPPPCPVWPPDVFAVAAYLLDETGSYVTLVESTLWPPVFDPADKFPTAVNWNEHACEIGRTWLPDVDAPTAPSVPAVVDAAWKDVLTTFWDLPIEQARDLSDDRSVRLAVGLSTLLAYADEASAGMGIPREPFDIKWNVRGSTHFQQDAIDRLLASSSEKSLDGSPKRAIATLCDRIDSSMVVVLPKTHTPQAGATIRSMSHHLALVRDTPVEIRWDINTGADPSKSRPLSDTLSLLLVPWPFSIPLKSFRPSERSRHRRELAQDHRYFDYDPPPMDDRTIRRIEDLIIAAEQQVGPINGVVFPELSMTRKTFDKLAQRPRVSELPILIAGVTDKRGSSEHAQNMALMRFQTHLTVPGPGGEKPLPPVEYVQHKHHRWFLERYQIENYGLAGMLDPEKQWWESTTFEPRRLNFVAMHHWLTLSLLICEDLARPDPVAEVVRAVGPNLVIALLLDGPQIAERWAARWASTLVDDPGSSVLILTSLGMTLRDARARGKRESRQVGLWKDRSGFKPLILGKNAAAIAITLAAETRTEYALDGRGDDDAASSVRLAAVHSIDFDLTN